MNLDHQTLESLDWPAVLTALADHARTPMGKRAAVVIQAVHTVDAVTALHDAVDEVRVLDESASDVPVGAVGDIGPLVLRATKGEILEHADLRLVGSSMNALRRLAWLLQARGDEVPILAAMAAGIHVDDVVADELEAAFDNTGQLSSRTYPALGDLRRRIQELHSAIRTTLDDLVGGDELGDVLQDRYVTQRGDRYVLPVKAHAKRWNIGIVHGTSGSGATVFVEPHQVVELNNRLRLAEGQLLAEERRILAQLSRMVGLCSADLDICLAITTDMDLLCARWGLARQLDATRPRVGSDGVIVLHDARHPVLVLRGVAVVGNDLRIQGARAALVLTGPNAGGKTVALKTIGLCALLVRIGAFVPAADGSRVDLFPEVLATIGDAQTVHGDLSSFSGHIVGLRGILDRARPGCLALLDELASGTDPGQGAALAQALLEALLDRGARVVVTTHFARLKALAEADERVGAAAVELVDGQPTYRVVADTSGDSHAFALAVRMGIPGAIVDRAEALMDTHERSLGESLRALEQARERAVAEERAAEATRRELEATRSELARREQKIAERSEELEQRAAAAFLDRLKRAERAISAVVADLQRGPDHRKVDAARATLSALSELVPTGEDTPEIDREPADLAVGDRVRVPRVRATGEVIGVGAALQVRTDAGLVLRLGRDEVERVSAGAPARRRPPRKPRNGAGRRVPLEAAVRVATNTLDMRGMRVDEGLDAADKFVDRAVQSGHDAVFLLHGHGTGALKEAIRDWLRTSAQIDTWAPANADQGGDAFTVAGLRG